MTPGDVQVTARLLSEWEKCSHHAAKRKLLAVARLRPDIVHRKGKRGDLWAWASDLEPYMPALRDTPMMKEIRQLRGRVAELEARMAHVIRKLEPVTV